MPAIALVALVAALVGACADRDADRTAADTASEGFPVVVDGVEVAAYPRRIASLSASHTEMVYALGAGDRVIATDLYSDFPPEAAATEKIDSFNLSTEAVAALDPDLVLLAFDPGEVVDGLAELGIPALLFDAPADVDGALDQMLAVGKAVGAPQEAEALVADLRAGIAAVLAEVPVGLDATYYHELDGNLYTVTSNTFVGSLYRMVGLENVADPAGSAGFEYPQLSAEFLIAADPDLVFLADTKCCGQSATAVTQRPGWDRLTAVSEGRIVELDDDVASRWGPRIVEFLTAIADATSLLGETP
jgi:iron complex transport system substrate-binding protein